MMRAATFFLLLALVGVLPAAAQRDAETDRAANEAIRGIRSPYCPGLMLEVCPSEPAERLRDSIRDMAAAGMAPQAIVEDVVARHGEEWRALPKRSGWGLWAWIIPPAGLVLGGIFLVGRLRAMRGPRAPAAAGPEPSAADPGLSDDERSQLEAALREWEAREEAGL